MTVPAHARLRFGAGVAGNGRRDPDAAGIRFTIGIDDRPAFTRTINPAGSRHDRRWFDADVPLGDRAREVEITLRTERAGAGVRLAGTPGWSPLRIVRDRVRERQRASAAAPSVLVLLVDTLRADRLGTYGSRAALTPTLDRIAAEGLVFEDMIAQASWTMPSVATLFTGLHPRSHGVVGRARKPGGTAVGDEDPAYLSDALATLPVLAQHAGITTVAVSGNPTVSRATNFARGFETFVEIGWDREAHDWPAAGDVNAPFLRWLAQNRGHRFLAYLHYMEPHDPYTPSGDARPPAPAGVRAEVAAGNVDPIARRINWSGGSPMPRAELEYLRTLYDLEVRDWDRALADLLRGVDDTGVRDSTVIVVLGDHGEEFQEHGRLKHGIHLYEELLRVPLVMTGPGIARGRVREQAQGIDLMPTLAALLDVAVPASAPGQNLLGPREPRPAFSETRSGLGPGGEPTELVSVRFEGWKLIHARALGRYELYDLRNDPGERENRFDGAPEGARLAAMLAAWETAAPPPPPVAGADPEITEKLRALGYVE